jgi:purine-binding chemotaxis protein CheW
MEKKKETPNSKSKKNQSSTIKNTAVKGLKDVTEKKLETEKSEKNKVLKERAKALARKKVVAGMNEKKLEVVEFLLAYEKYAIETSYVREVYPLRDLTPVPCTPPFVFGVINFRGQTLSVIDIKKIFDLPEKGLTDLNMVIIVRNNEMEMGILADSIFGVRSIPISEIQTSLPMMTGIREKYLKGVTKEQTVILDAHQLLTDKKIVVHEDVEAQAKHYILGQ